MRKVKILKQKYKVDERGTKTYLDEYEVAGSGIFLEWSHNGNYPHAIVELPDGKIDVLIPELIQFEKEAQEVPMWFEGTIVKHKKTGGIYQIVGSALQTETSDNLMIYKSQEGKLFARPYGMFWDGRFKIVTP